MGNTLIQNIHGQMCRMLYGLLDGGEKSEPEEAVFGDGGKYGWVFHRGRCITGLDWDRQPGNHGVIGCPPVASGGLVCCIGLWTCCPRLMQSKVMSSQSCTFHVHWYAGYELTWNLMLASNAPTTV